MFITYNYNLLNAFFIYFEILKFLKTGMSFEPGENLLEVFVVSGTFVGQGPDGASALPTSSIMFNGQAVTLNDDSTTFVMCDFYDYETQTTPLLLGK